MADYLVLRDLFCCRFTALSTTDHVLKDENNSPHVNYCLSVSHEDLSFSKGDIITVVGLEPIYVRAEVKGDERVLDVINIPLEYEGTGYKTLPFWSCDSSEHT